MKSWRRQFHNQYASVNLAYVAHAEALKSHDDLLLQDYAQLFVTPLEPTAKFQPIDIEMCTNNRLALSLTKTSCSVVSLIMTMP